SPAPRTCCSATPSSAPCSRGSPFPAHSPAGSGSGSTAAAAARPAAGRRAAAPRVAARPGAAFRCAAPPGPFGGRRPRPPAVAAVLLGSTVVRLHPRRLAPVVEPARKRAGSDEPVRRRHLVRATVLHPGLAVPGDRSIARVDDLPGGRREVVVRGRHLFSFP